MPAKKPRLSANAQQIAEVYAVVHPRRPVRSKAMSWLNHARRNITGEKSIRNDEFRDALEELFDNRLLLPSIESQSGVASMGPSAIAGTLTRFCESAVERHVADSFLNDLEGNSRLHYSYVDPHGPPENVVQKLRIALIENDAERFADMPLPGNVWFWLTEPEAKRYLQRVPLQQQHLACQFGLVYLIQNLLPFSEFTTSVRQLLDSPDCECLIARGCIFAGEFDQAEDELLGLQAYATELMAGDEPASHQDKVLLQECISIQAMLATLKGEHDEAVRLIDATIKIMKSGTRKRVVYHDSLSFSIACLSLLRVGTPSARALFESLMKARTKLGLESDMDPLFDAAMEAERHRPGLGTTVYPGAPTIVSVIAAVATRWHQDYQLPKLESYMRWLDNMIVTASRAGYHWAVAELLTVLEATNPDSKTYSKDVKAIYKSANGEQRHKQLGSQSLTSLVTMLTPWEHALRDLEKIALADGPKKGGKAKQATESSRRLIWRVSIDSFGEVECTPVEQTLGKNGQWSGGRRMSLKRLREQTGKLPPLNEQDLKAGASIQKHASYGWGSGGTTYETTVRTLYQLIGHPLVFSEDGLAIDVVEYPPQLTVKETDQGTRATVAPYSHGEPYQAALDTSQNRLLVTRFTAAHLRILEAIPAEGLDLPTEASERLQNVVATLSDTISVQAESNTGVAAAVPGDPTPLLVLEPHGDTLRVRLRVEPLENSNSFFDAGMGGSVVYVPTQKGTSVIERDLANEQSLLTSMISQSTILSLHYDGRPHLILNDTIEALELLEEVQSINIKCIWPGDIPFRIKAHVGVNQVTLNIDSGTDWFSATGTVDTEDNDGTTLSIERLFELMNVQNSSRFVELGNGEFVALSKTLKQQLDTWTAYKKPSRADTREERTHALGLLALQPLFDAANVTGNKAWRQQRKAIQAALSQTPDVPSTLQAELRSYQLEGFNWLTQLGQIGAGACLADDMGLGKTVQTLATLLTRASNGPALVVAPTSVTGNWLQEAQRFSPSLNIMQFSSNSSGRETMLDGLGNFDVVVISYGLLSSSIESLKKLEWNTVVLDEAQAIKNSATQRARAARQLNANFRVATTGTPVQNNLMDLHSLFSFLNPGLLGSEAVFRKRFALPITRENDSHAQDELKSLVSPFLLRRHKRDVLKELPARTDVTLDIKLSGEEAALYDMVRKEALHSLEHGAEQKNIGKQKIIVLSYLTKLRRLCCNPKLVAPDWQGPMSKLSVFSDTLAEIIASGHKALVFSQFVDHLKIVEEHIKKSELKYQYLDGSTTAKQRTERVNAFQGGDGDVFLISLTAGGTGLNLTAADYVIHLDPWWNPAVEDQASDRAHRLGQQRPVTVLRMVSSNTIEEQIQELHKNKRDLADSVLAGSQSGSLDMDTLMSLLQISE